MLFMVIETFREQDAKRIYRRLEEQGRMMPDGLSFVHSHVAADLSRCWQLMETDDVTKIQLWISRWNDVMAFEVVPVTDGVQTRKAMKDLS